MKTKENKLPNSEEYIKDYYPHQNGDNYSHEQVRRMLTGFGIRIRDYTLEIVSENVKVIRINKVSIGDKFKDIIVLEDNPNFTLDKDSILNLKNSEELKI